MFFSKSVASSSLYFVEWAIQQQIRTAPLKLARKIEKKACHDGRSFSATGYPCVPSPSSSNGNWRKRLCCKKAGDLVSSASIQESRGVPFMNNQNPFKWRHFEADIILLCVRWYLRYSLSYRDLEEMMRERGLHVDHTTIYRWVQRYAPELEKRSRPHLQACNDSWRVDETYIKIKKTWMYLYRAVDSEGNTLEFLLSPARDAEAAKPFFLKALRSPACSAPGARLVEEQVEEPTAAAASNTTTPAPRVINVDQNAAYPKP